MATGKNRAGRILLFSLKTIALNMISSFFRIFPKEGGCFMNESARPLDALNEARGKRTIVELKNGKQYIGNLRAFDIHINVVLENAEEREAGEVKRKLGVVFLSGDTITIISPA